MGYVTVIFINDLVGVEVAQFANEAFEVLLVRNTRSRGMPPQNLYSQFSAFAECLVYF